MKYVVEKNLRDFEFWSGGADRANNCSDEELDSIEEFLIEIEPEDGWTDTYINDMFWFEFDTLAQHLGYKDEEDFDRRHDPNYVDDDEFEELVEKWFKDFLGRCGDISQINCDLYCECCGELEDICNTPEEAEEVRMAPSYPVWACERAYAELMKLDSDKIMEYLIEDDNGHTANCEFPSKEDIRDEMMFEKR